MGQEEENPVNEEEKVERQKQTKVQLVIAVKRVLSTNHRTPSEDALPHNVVVRRSILKPINGVGFLSLSCVNYDPQYVCENQKCT